MNDTFRLLCFDASIDLTDQAIPAGMAPTEAVGRVLRAVGAIPGAGWVSVDYAGKAPAGLPLVRLFTPGTASAQTEGRWAGQAGMVQAVARFALGKCP